MSILLVKRMVQRRCISTGVRYLTTMQLIKKLREEIQAPLNIVKNAVSQAQPVGDYDDALRILKAEMVKRGEKLVAKAADRNTAEGWVIAARTTDGRQASISVLNCETDFVANNAKVVDLAQSIGRNLAANTSFSTDHDKHTSLSQLQIDEATSDGQPLKVQLTESMSLYGESIRMTRASFTQLPTTSSTVLGIHCHGGPSVSKQVYLGRMGALVNLSSNSRDVAGIADELAREIVAQNPESIDELWTLEKVGDSEGRTVRQWAGDDVQISAWTRMERSV